ncbi:MAG: glutamate-5-semialdehyde dehydrogenase [Candidatus Eisenbacteria bacterium]|uniref:Gamma-glutamyl phosphate reductase n=1 Tax=Eiseniibacteriota bacterium TaxID=2212470 RepID=A0A956SFB3_UNCEI|nr:glutamate-5-semialdehyde dehydrogenase [Candidatus Eisenbacteria bacterium]
MNRVPTPTISTIRRMAEAARSASRTLAQAPTSRRNDVLLDLATRIERSSAQILTANQADVAEARSSGLGMAKLKRLELTPASIAAMAEGVRQVAALPDPIDRVVKSWTTPAGLDVAKVGVPLGVILMIYESRPNVTIDAFALCFKSGNACILKGGREARFSNEALGALVHKSLQAHRVPTASMNVFSTSDRDAMEELLQFDDLIDLCIPRGGESLIRFVHDRAKMPTVQHYHGVCHVYVDRAADQEMALEIALTAKTSAPATCNAAECILVDEAIAEEFLPQLVDGFVSHGVSVHADLAALSRLERRDAPSGPGAVSVATEGDWGKEFLDLVVAVKVVPGLEGALAHIERYSSGHTDAIVTGDPDTANEFLRRVHSSCALVNASTRFNDGFQLGLGAEIGISTSRVHAYGPMGLEELTAQRYVVRGDGHVR